LGLYLCVWDEVEEVDGVEVGSYVDYGRFIEKVVEHVEGGARGSRCPTLTLHSDCDGQWSPEECIQLRKELNQISQAFAALPPIPLSELWQQMVAKTMGLQPKVLLDCFFDVDGEPLVARLVNLSQVAIDRGKPILFQ
jgi:hypothetical protein